MPPATQTATEEKKVRQPKNPYTVTPEEGFNFVDGKTVPFKGWRVTLHAPRGEKPVSVILYEANLTHELLNSVLASRNAENGAKA